MAQVWRDNVGSFSTIIMSNNQQNLVFKWDFVTFSGEEQLQAQVRWRKMGNANLVASDGVSGIMRESDNQWTTPVDIGRFEDTTTWTLSGGQLVPPAAASRRYSNITQISFPMNFFSAGVWAIGVRMIAVGTTDWSAYTVHKVEVNDYDDRQFNDAPTGNSMVKGPGFPNEGTYGVRVEVVSNVGIPATSLEQQFEVYSTDKYTFRNGVVQAIPEFYNNGANVGRVKRTT